MRAKGRGVGGSVRIFSSANGPPGFSVPEYGYPRAAPVLAKADAARASRGGVAITRKTHDTPS
jgi:hypothetical protein